MISLLVAGAFGGLIRGLVGFTKHQFAYKNVKFEPSYFLSLMAISSAIGLVVTWAVVASGLKLPAIESINPAIAFIVGYAGGDVIENIYKIIVRKDSLFLPTKE